MKKLRFNWAAAVLTPMLAFAILVGGMSHSFSQATRTECDDAWKDSEAADVCTTITITFQEQGSCSLYVNCTVSATLSDGTSTASTSWTLSDSSTRTGAAIRTLDVCFAASTTATNGYDAAFKAGCDTGEKTSDDISGSTITVTSLP